MSEASSHRVLGPLFTASFIVFLLAVLALNLLIFAGVGYRLQWWSLGFAFALLRWGAWLGLAAAVLGAVAASIAFRKGRRGIAVLALAAVAVGAVSAFIPWQWQSKAGEVPPIHDISTDTRTPPEFVAIAPLRADAPNPAAYAGEQAARAQREAYPDIDTIRLDAPPEEVFDAAVETADALGWQLVAADPSPWRIEATDTTRWFGFKDDVVIRIRPDESVTLVDVRSKSRLGRSDAGTNAERIRAFRDRLKEELGGNGS